MRCSLCIIPTEFCSNEITSIFSNQNIRHPPKHLESAHPKEAPTHHPKYQPTLSSCALITADRENKTKNATFRHITRAPPDPRPYRHIHPRHSAKLGGAHDRRSVRGKKKRSTARPPRRRSRRAGMKGSTALRVHVRAFYGVLPCFRLVFRAALSGPSYLSYFKRPNDALARAARTIRCRCCCCCCLSFRPPVYFFQVFSAGRGGTGRCELFFFFFVRSQARE